MAVKKKAEKKTEKNALKKTVVRAKEKNTAARKSSTKQSVTKKSVSQKPAPKKQAKKISAKAKKAVVKKSVDRGSTGKSQTAKRTAIRSVASRKTVLKKSPMKKAVPKVAEKKKELTQNRNSKKGSVKNRITRKPGMKKDQTKAVADTKRKKTGKAKTLNPMKKSLQTNQTGTTVRKVKLKKTKEKSLSTISARKPRKAERTTKSTKKTVRDKTTEMNERKEMAVHPKKRGRKPSTELQEPTQPPKKRGRKPSREKMLGTMDDAALLKEVATPQAEIKPKRKYTRRVKKPAAPIVLPKYQGKQGIPVAKKAEPEPAIAAKKGKKRVQYSAKDLEYFRKLIVEKIQDANEELLSIEERLINQATGEYHDDDATYSLHMADQGTDAMEREKAFLFAQRERKFISHLSDALQRIKSGNYGICIICGNLIDKGRLEAVPHARMCVNCKNLSK